MSKSSSSNVDKPADKYSQKVNSAQLLTANAVKPSHILVAVWYLRTVSLAVAVTNEQLGAGNG